MASKAPRDWDLMELDPVIEIQGQKVIRKLERRMPEFKLSQVAFFRALLVMVECLVPNCTGHQKYGVVIDENIPVVFRRHEVGNSPIYTTYKNALGKPIRVPENGDYLLMGLKWKSLDMPMVEAIRAAQCVFDCLIADLRVRMMLKEFCLECLFSHSNGKGLLLERFVKTVLYHVVPWGRIKDSVQYTPVRSYEKKMDMKLKRIYWGDKTFKLQCDPVKLQVHCNIGSPERPILMSMDQFNGYTINAQTGILRNFDSVTKINLLVKCNCEGGRLKMKEAYCGLLRKVKTNAEKEIVFSITLARWTTRGDEYEDPLWDFSMLGNDLPTGYFKTNATSPISRNCEKCKSFINIVDTSVPRTTWLFMADVADNLRKVSLKSLQKISAYHVDNVTFVPAFVLVYNTKNSRFTTINLIRKDEWRFFDDLCGGLFKHCDPDKVKYTDRLNLRVFFYRKTEINPHVCLSLAAAANASAAH